MSVGVMETILIGVFTVLIGACVVGIFASASEHSRLMKNCISDGHKEYECIGILKGRG